MKNLNLEKLMQAQFDVAKLWLTLATGSGVIVLLIDILVAIVSQWGIFLAPLAALLTVLNSIFLWRSYRLRDTAETILRKYEMHKSLGWEISAREISDILVRAPKKVKKSARTNEIYTYFASTKNIGVEKLLENLEESAWWSKHQARRMSLYVGAFGVATLAIAVITLIISLRSALAISVSNSIAGIATSLIVFIFSGDYIKLAFDYGLFSNQARGYEEKTFQLRRGGKISDIEAIKLFNDYQIDRAGSPLLPTWLWESMSKELNEIWEERLQKS